VPKHFGLGECVGMPMDKGFALIGEIAGDVAEEIAN
jgi:hypothetical protein